MCMISSHSKTIKEYEREENNVMREGYKRGYSNLVNKNASIKIPFSCIVFSIRVV